MSQYASDPQQQLSEAVYALGLRWGIQLVAGGTVADFRHHPPPPPPAPLRSKKAKRQSGGNAATPSAKRQRRTPAAATRPCGGDVEQKITAMVLLLQEIPLPPGSGWSCNCTVRRGTSEKAGYTDTHFTAPSKNQCTLKVLFSMLRQVIAHHQRPADFSYDEVWYLVPWYLALYDIRHEFLDGGRYKIGGCYPEHIMGVLPEERLRIAREVCAGMRSIPEPVDVQQGEHAVALVDALEMQSLLPYLESDVPVLAANLQYQQQPYDIASLEADLNTILGSKPVRRAGVEQFERAQAVKCIDFVGHTITNPVAFLDSLLSESGDELVREMMGARTFHAVHGTPHSAPTWELAFATFAAGDEEASRLICYTLAPVFVYFLQPDGVEYMRCFSGWELRRPGRTDQGGSIAGPHYVAGRVSNDSVDIVGTMHKYLRALDLERSKAIKEEKKASQHRYEVLLHLSLPLYDPQAGRVYHEEKWFPLSCGIDAQDPCMFRICAAPHSLPLDNRASPSGLVIGEKKEEAEDRTQLQLEQLFDIRVEDLVDYCARERLAVRIEGDPEDEKNVRLPLVNAILAKHGLAALFS